MDSDAQFMQDGLSPGTGSGRGSGRAAGWRRFVARHGMCTTPDAQGSPRAKPRRSTGADAFLLHLSNLMRAPTLDVDVASHCNLNCASCCHFAPLAPPRLLELADYERDLEALARIEGIATFFEAICLMGGEPLLHPQLPALIRATHARLPETQVRVVSNGLLLASVDPDFWAAMRETGADLLLTPYPTSLDYAALVELARVRGVHAVVGGGLSFDTGGGPYFLRTPLDETGAQDPTASFVSCPLGGVTMQLAGGRIFPCNPGALIDTLNERFDTAFAHEPDDYLALDAIERVEELDRFRRVAHPMCRYCASERAERVVWHPSARDRFEWLMRPDERGGCEG